MPCHAQCVAFLCQQLWSYEMAHRALASQEIPRAPSGNPFAPDAPWKREDLHRVGQDDCEKLGGIFYFRILWFNVSPSGRYTSACTYRHAAVDSRPVYFACMLESSYC